MTHRDPLRSSGLPSARPSPLPPAPPRVLHTCWDPFRTSSAHASPVPAYTASQLDRISGDTAAVATDSDNSSARTEARDGAAAAAGVPSASHGSIDATAATSSFSPAIAASSSSAAPISSADPSAKRARIATAVAAPPLPLPLPLPLASDVDDSDDDENVAITTLVKRTTSPALATATTVAPVPAAAAQDVIDLTQVSPSPPPSLLPPPRPSTTHAVQTPWTKSLLAARSQLRTVAAAPKHAAAHPAHAASASVAAGVSTFATAASLVAAAATSSPRFENTPPQQLQPSQAAAPPASVARHAVASSGVKRPRDERPLPLPLPASSQPTPSPPSRFLQEEDALDADAYDKLFETARASTTAVTAAAAQPTPQPPLPLPIAPSATAPAPAPATTRSVSPHFPFAAAAASSAAAATARPAVPSRPLQFTPQPSATLLGHCGISPSATAAMMASAAAASSAATAALVSGLQSFSIPLSQQQEWPRRSRMPPVLPWSHRGLREVPPLKGRSSLRQDEMRDDADAAAAASSSTMLVDSPLMQFLAQRS